MLREGQNLGWPYTYWDPLRKARMVSPEFGGDGKKRDESGKYQEPLIAFPAHWAPLQTVFYTGKQFPAKYSGGAFIAFHGSWNRAPLPQRGYHVVFVPFDAQGKPVGNYEIFARGFAGRDEFTSPRDATYRPGGVAVGPDGSLYIGETEKGRIWRVIYVGDKKVTDRAVAAAGASTAAPTTLARIPGKENVAGKILYSQHCASCHMVDGSGVPNMQPSLADSTVLKGDPATLLRSILKGPAAVLPADRPKYGNAMAAFDTVLDDNQLADLATYVRQAFGGGASAVTPAQVAAARKQP